MDPIKLRLSAEIDADDGRHASSDIGNLSFSLSAIHPTLAIVDPEVPGHSEIFGQAAICPRGKATLLKAARLLAMTAYDFLAPAELREKGKRAFEQKG